MEIRDKENRTTQEDFILTIWSFGNSRENYIYWKSIENRKFLTHKICFSKTESEYKEWIQKYNDEKAGHFEKYWAIWDCFLIDDDFWEFIKSKNKRIYKFWKNANYYRKFHKWFDMDLFIEKRWKFVNTKDIELLNDLLKYKELNELENIKSIQNIEHLQQLESLERLQRLQRLERLERFQMKNIFNLSYENLELPKPDECILYFDPPYKDTAWYGQVFDYEKFYYYILELKEKWYTIFVSEYNFPFGEVIWGKLKRGFISQEKEDFTGMEKLYFIKK